MFSSQDVDYSLNRPCRCLSAVARPPSSKCGPGQGPDDDSGGGAIGGWGDDDGYLDLDSSSSSLAGHRFLAGTATPSVSRLASGDHGAVIEEEDDEDRANRLCLLRYDEDSHELALERSWTHPPGEVWSVACHPLRADWVVTCGGGAVFSASMMMEGGGVGGRGRGREGVPLAKFRTALWRLPELNTEECDEDDIEFSNEPRRRSESAASAMTSSSRMDLLVTIPHGESRSSNPSGWGQRVGQVLWNPLLLPSQASGDAMFDLAETLSGTMAGNILTLGWDALSPISLWDISSPSEAREIWSASGGVGVTTSRGRIGSRFGRSLTGSVLPRRASWSPHDTRCVLAASGVDVVSYDVRIPASSGAGAGTAVLRSAHRHGVTDVCHNPLKPNALVTSGMDGVIKFWDLRMHLSDGSLDAMGECGGEGQPSAAPSPPLLKAVRGGHSHWTTCVAYNPFHDQLVLSGGSDGVANLWRISSCSSAPLLDLEGEGDDDGCSGGGNFDGESDAADEEGEEDAEDGMAGGDYGHSGWFEEVKKPLPEGSGKDEDKSNSPAKESNAQDIRVKRFECSDGTADIAWSASDPWVYATLSYDGGVVVHHVPSKEKYKILL